MSDTLPERVYLCHKCSGALTQTRAFLFGCVCISGWVREWQEPVSIEDAVLAQAIMAESNIAFYRQRNAPGDADRIPYELEKIKRLGF